MASVIHELATNAAKYGSFSNEGARIEVRWRVGREGGGAQVQLCWQEVLGPAVTQAHDTGFGSILLEKAALQLGGHITREWVADGVCATLVFPLEVE